MNLWRCMLAINQKHILLTLIIWQCRELYRIVDCLLIRKLRFLSDSLLPNFSKARATEPVHTRPQGWAIKLKSACTLFERFLTRQSPLPIMSSRLLVCVSAVFVSGLFSPFSQFETEAVLLRSLSASLESSLQPVSLDTDPDLACRCGIKVASLLGFVVDASEKTSQGMSVSPRKKFLCK